MSQTIWLNRDNTIDIALMDNNIPVGADLVTSWEFYLTPRSVGASIIINSTVAATAFDTSHSMLVGSATVRILKLRMGHQAIPPGEYMARIVGYDTDHAEGLVWGEFLVTVRS